MKLSKEQRWALASKIQDELKKANEEFKKTEDYVNFENTLRNDSTYKTLKKIKELAEGLGEVKELPVHRLKDVVTTLNSYVINVRNKAFVIPVVPNHSEIEQKIILATIDTTTLDELVEKVKESLK